ncbi:unnamed protein product [Rotaria magnacalcarata]|uniref:Plasma membrane ATPase n=4 Tax=Rotaria magnacalcarata TaxID=392030 RepID=A0A815MC93_9BILA|nr:unnamed protein product [Rotaria magnacalcarata]
MVDEQPKSTYVILPENSIKNLTVAELYDKEKYDLSTMVEVDVFTMLDATREGLTDEEVNERLLKFGHNRLEHKEKSAIIQFLLFMWNPLSWVMEAAAIVAIVVSNGGGKPPDWEDFVGIILLLLANSIIGFVEQRNAGNAVKALMESLAPEAKVKRNGEWKVIEAATLVPGDIISVKLGDVIPADARLFAAHGGVSIDQAALTGESLPVTKTAGDEIFSGSTCKQGEAEAIVIGTGLNTFFGRAAKLVGNSSDEIGHLQTILAKIGNFCIIGIAMFIVAEILVMYAGFRYEYRRGINNFAGFRYEYRRGINNLLVLLIGGIPIAMPTVLSVTLAIGAKQLSQHKAIVTHVTAIEELAAVTILCSDKTGTLTLNKLVINKPSVKQYSDIGIDEIIHYAAIASRTENQDAIDTCITGAYGDIKTIRAGIQELEFKPFNPTNKRTEITYKRISDGTVHRISKGMSHSILDLCTRNKTQEQIKQMNADVDEFARRGLRALAVAIEDVPSGEIEGEGNGFELVGLLPIYDPPRSDTKETIERAIALGVKVKMITGDQLAIAKETGRRLGMGDNMYLSKTLKDGPPPESGYRDVDDLVLHADGFAGVYPEHKYEIVEKLQKLGYIIAMTGDGVNDAPALSRANVGVAVADASDAARSAADIVLTEPGLSVIIEGRKIPFSLSKFAPENETFLVANVGVAVADASDAARSAADIVLTEPGLSVIIEAILGSRQIFQRMRNYAIYTCSITIRVIVGFSVLIFAFKFDFPSFMVLILAILNDGTIMTISKDRVKPSPYPNSWNLTEIFTYAIVYGIYLAASTVAFFAVAVKTDFFQKFGVTKIVYGNSSSSYPGWNDPVLHSVIYLQVSTISQALIFVTRSHGFFFMERPSIILVVAFMVAQLVATFIAVWANWSFTDIKGCGWKWAGVVWIWNIVWFFPLDGFKYALRAYFDPIQKRAIEELLTPEPSTQAQTSRRKSTLAAAGSGPLSRRSTMVGGDSSRSRRGTFIEATAKYYAPQTEHLSTSRLHRNFARLFKSEGVDAPRIAVDHDELRRFSLVQAHHASKLLNPNGTNANRRTTTAL